MRPERDTKLEPEWSLDSVGHDRQASEAIAAQMSY